MGDGNTDERLGDEVQRPGRLASSRLAYLTSRWLVGLVLILAGVGKLSVQQPILAAGVWVLPAFAATAWGVVELLLGCVVLSFRPYRWLPVFLAALFGVFAAMLLTQAWHGVTQCQCLGGGTPIWGMIGLDVVILLGVIVTRQHWSQPIGPFAGLRGDLMKHSWYAIPLLLVISMMVFGSPAAVVEYLAGRSVVSPGKEQFAGSVTVGQRVSRTFSLKNVSNRPVRVVGAKTSCRCIGTQDLPLELPPGQSRSLRIDLVASEAAGVQREFAQLVLDDSSPALVLGVTALVHRGQ